MTIDYLDTVNYGVWLTLSSFIAWFSFFDIGLGNGLRNKFAEAKTNGDITLARGYISSAYFTIGSLCLTLILIFIALNFFIDWTKVFNVSTFMEKDLRLLMPIVFSFFCLQLVVKLITTIYMADQNHSMEGRVNFFTQGGSLLIIWLMTFTNGGSLLAFAIVFSFLPVIILTGMNFYAFNHTYKDYKPSLILWKKKYLKDIFGLGVNFFIIQIAATILFSTDNIIITQMFGPEEVVEYNLAFRYFSIVTMVYTIIVSPYWSSFTEAFSNMDFEWIKKSVLNIQKIWIIVPILLVLMIIISDWFYKFWIGDKISVSKGLTVSMAIYVLLITFNMIYVNFINGVGKVKLQLLTSILSMIINVPLSIYFGKYLGWGSSGVILATCFSLMYSAILRPIQYYKLINKSATGLWDK